MSHFNVPEWMPKPEAQKEVPTYWAREFRAKPVVKPFPIIEGLLSTGKRMLLGGSPKSNKSWITMHLALCVARGLPWMGFKTNRTMVLYVDFELDDWDLQFRMEEIANEIGIARDEDIDMQLLALRDADEAVTVAELRLLLKERIEALRASGSEHFLIIIDPFYWLLDENADELNPSQMVGILRSFRTLNRLGASIIFTMHFAKGSQAQKFAIDRISGTGGFGRDADVIMTVTSHKDELNAAYEFYVRSFATPKSFTAAWEFPLMVRNQKDPTDLREPKKSGRRQVVSDFELMEFARSVNRKFRRPDWIGTLIERFGIGRATAQRYLAELLAEGQLDESPSEKLVGVPGNMKFDI
ncbi:MAG TPA: AAA family ATPase [Chthoniobacterales bacterium]|nr:AAA family ATPase [Chthoniobacterales bacterium]